MCEQIRGDTIDSSLPSEMLTHAIEMILLMGCLRVRGQLFCHYSTGYRDAVGFGIDENFIISGSI